MRSRAFPFGAVFAALLITLSAGIARAQVQVDIRLSRTLYIIYEPVVLTVTITNLSGNELELRDVDHNRWFSLQVETLDGRPIPPSDASYFNEPLSLGAGQKISRSLNVTPLFPIGEFGAYRLKASVFVAKNNRFYSSPSLNIEVTDGKVMWQQTVGVPDGMPGAGTMREISLLSHRQPQSTQLYIRIQDKQNGIVYCTHQLGRFLNFGSPNVMLDEKNRVHILQNVAPKSFVYSQIGLNGEVVQRKSFNELSSRPALRRGSDGSVLVVGGAAFDPTAPPPEAAIPSMSDRPVPLPGASGKPTPDDKRPDNLLSR
ncbi:MAG: hypothetical protein ACOYNN_03815 [Terrimicrobiaceae bacterium]